MCMKYIQLILRHKHDYHTQKTIQISPTLTVPKDNVKDECVEAWRVDVEHLQQQAMKLCLYWQSSVRGLCLIYSPFTVHCYFLSPVTHKYSFTFLHTQCIPHNTWIPCMAESDLHTSSKLSLFILISFSLPPAFTHSDSPHHQRPVQCCKDRPESRVHPLCTLS